MKKLIILIVTTSFLLFGGVIHSASAQNNTGKLYGMVKDSVNEQPLELVTLNLKTDKDSLLKTVVSKQGGKFLFEGLKIAKYHLVIVLAGYVLKVINIDMDNLNKDIGTIELSKRAKDLKEVTITADRSIVQQKADRIIYDMQADPESKGNSVLSMIHKIPYLSVDADDNVQMKGSSNFKVLINGKPSGMLTNNLKEVLRSMPASTVVRIEVITIPPSKYDAEGQGGIINIITNKKINDGYKGTLNVNDNFPKGGPGVGGSFTAQDGKFGINSYYGGSLYHQPLENNSVSRITTGTSPSDLAQSGYNKSDSKNAYIGTELSYEIDTLNLLSGSFNVNGNRYNGSAYQTSSLTGGGALLQAYNLNNDNHGNGGGFDAALNYQLGFRSNKNTLLTFSYQYSNYGSNDHTNIDISNPVDYPTPDYNQLNNQDSKEQTFQVDYAAPIKKVNMELGVKAILRNSKSDFEYRSLDSASNLFLVDPAMSDMFNYTQDVFGAYNSYQFNLKTWSFNAGLRAEQTDINADFESSGTKTSQHYFNVVPTVAVNKTFKDNSGISFGFTQRLRRPSIYRLNPFVDRSNPDVISSGNPNLQPETINIIQAGYSSPGGKKLLIFIGSDYNFFNNLDLQVSHYDQATHITTLTYQNTGKGGGVELNLNINYSPNKLYNLSINAGTLDLFINGTGDDAASKLDRILFHGSVSNGFRFNNGWSANANFDYTSRNPNSLQSINNAYAGTSLSVNKELIKNKLFFSAGVNNPFTKFRNKVTTTTGPDFVEIDNNQYYYRSLNFSLNYNFGRLKSDIKKSRKDINNDDTSNRKGGGL